jgi:hypothetical protein
MSVSAHRRATPSVTDGDGVRVVATSQPVPRVAFAIAAIGIVLVASLAWIQFGSPPAADVGEVVATRPVERPATRVPNPPPHRLAAEAPRPRRVLAPEPVEANQSPDDLPSTDPTDLAAWIRPTDPEPTAGEVIEALQASGDHTGLGAFNPPGTSPPLAGLAVPEDYVLPPGYVRHHQVTDEGEPLEPILMFSPDYAFHDAAGRAVPIPEDRVVTPELAPPDLPIRPMTPPRP